MLFEKLLPFRRKVSLFRHQKLEVEVVPPMVMPYQITFSLIKKFYEYYHYFLLFVNNKKNHKIITKTYFLLLSFKLYHLGIVLKP